MDFTLGFAVGTLTGTLFTQIILMGFFKRMKQDNEELRTKVETLTIDRAFCEPSAKPARTMWD